MWARSFPRGASAVIPRDRAACFWRSPWSAGCTGGLPTEPSDARAARPTTTGARAHWRRLPVKGWDRSPTSPVTGSASPGATTSTSSSATTAAIPATTSCAATSPTGREAGTCYAQSGVLLDPYTGESIPFVRGPATSEAVQIDHVVSLSDAWYKGARDWDEQRRRDFANDPRNLLAVGAKANFDKAFRDANAWLPPNDGVPLRVRRTAGRGENRLPAVGFGEREAGDGSGVGPLLAEWRPGRRPGSAHVSSARRAVRRAGGRRVRRRGPRPPAAPSDRPAAASGRRTLRRAPAAPRPVDREGRHQTTAARRDRVAGSQRLRGLAQSEPRLHQAAGAVLAPLQRQRACRRRRGGRRQQHPHAAPQQRIDQFGRAGLGADGHIGANRFTGADERRQVPSTARGPRRRAARRQRAAGQQDLGPQLGLRLPATASTMTASSRTAKRTQRALAGLTEQDVMV